MPVDILLPPRSKDIGGGFVVRRLLPSLPWQAVGPFVVFDHFGPVTTHPGDNHDVRPHPHIGLATVTYLFEGAMIHRDSLGSVQRIEPGAINWMSAGRGIVHSERAPDELRGTTHVSHGLQLWAALPLAHEESAPAFAHTPATAIPVEERAGLTVRVLIGALGGRRSPAATVMDTLYLDVAAQPGSRLELPATTSGAVQERAVYSIDRSLDVDGSEVPPFTLAVLSQGPAAIVAPAGARYVVVGGAPLDAPRFLSWNFVASSKGLIERAQQAWREQAMGSIAGEHEFIPLP